MKELGIMVDTPSIYIAYLAAHNDGTLRKARNA